MTTYSGFQRMTVLNMMWSLNELGLAPHVSFTVVSKEEWAFLRDFGDTYEE